MKKQNPPWNVTTTNSQIISISVYKYPDIHDQLSQYTISDANPHKNISLSITPDLCKLIDLLRKDIPRTDYVIAAIQTFLTFLHHIPPMGLLFSRSEFIRNAIIYFIGSKEDQEYIKQLNLEEIKQQQNKRNLTVPFQGLNYPNHTYNVFSKELYMNVLFGFIYEADRWITHRELQDLSKIQKSRVIVSCRKMVKRRPDLVIRSKKNLNTSNYTFDHPYIYKINKQAFLDEYIIGTNEGVIEIGHTH